MEITQALMNMPAMSLLTVPILLLEVRGYSRLHIEFDNSIMGKYCISSLWNAREKNTRWLILVSGWMKEVGSMVCLIMFTDMSVYWIHRLLHHKLIYKVKFFFVFEKSFWWILIVFVFAISTFTNLIISGK